MRLLVCGGRDYADRAAVQEALDALRPSSIIHGDARGADSLADSWAFDMGIDRWHYPISPMDWKQHGKAAGPIRNQRMLDEGKPDMVLAFPGGRGTADMVRRAEMGHVPVLRWPEDRGLVQSMAHTFHRKCRVEGRQSPPDAR